MALRRASNLHSRRSREPAGLVATVGAACAMLLFVGARPVAGQGVRPVKAAANELALSIEPLAVGGRYLHWLGPRWGLGLAASAGPHAGVTLAEAEADDVREWAASHVVVGWSGPKLRALLGAGAAGVTGNDFGAIYPHGRADVELALGRFRLAMSVRILRIASGYGRGTYRVQWVPLRAGWAFAW